MIANRQEQPILQDIKKVVLPPIEKLSLDNGIPLWLINIGSQDIIKVQISIPAGTIYQKHSLTAFFANKMLSEGSEKYSAAEIAEKIDYYGAFVDTRITRDHAYINIFSLNKHLNAVLQIVSDLLVKPSMPQHELDIMIQQEKQSFAIQMQKGKNLARREFNALIFGKEHPYGSLASIKDYDEINRESLLNFFQKNYQPSNWHLFVSGKINDSTLETLNKHFGQMPIMANNSHQITINDPRDPKTSNTFIEQKSAMQTALKIGKLSLDRMHDDYPVLSLTHTVLGGYFGSRLMKNIREDKGYTYGIYSQITHHQQASVFSISSELGSEVAADALKEVNKELQLLREKKVSVEELNLVKNYIAGSFLRSLNGPFALGEMMRMTYENNLPDNYFANHLSAIHAATREDVLRVADTYLNETEMLSVMVGSKKKLKLSE